MQNLHDSQLRSFLEKIVKHVQYYHNNYKSKGPRGNPNPGSPIKIQESLNYPYVHLAWVWEPLTKVVHARSESIAGGGAWQRHGQRRILESVPRQACGCPARIPLGRDARQRHVATARPDRGVTGSQRPKLQDVFNSLVLTIFFVFSFYFQQIEGGREPIFLCKWLGNPTVTYHTSLKPFKKSYLHIKLYYSSI